MAKRLPPILPAHEPVVMPELPPTVEIRTLAQHRAATDPLRSRILGVLQNQPATAKQLAERLGSTPGAIGHHLKLLARHGLVQIVARRQMRGIVANYYARTARILAFNASYATLAGDLDRAAILTVARDELAQMASEPRAQHAEREPFVLTYPHLQLSPRRALALSKRLKRLMDELIATPNEPGQPLYGVALGFFRAPQFLQPNEVRDKATGVGPQASADAVKSRASSKAPVRRTKRLRPKPSTYA